MESDTKMTIGKSPVSSLDKGEVTNPVEEKKSGKKWMYVAIIAILIALMLAGGLIYSLWLLDSKNKESNTDGVEPTPTLTSTPTATVTPTITATSTTITTPTSSTKTYVSSYLDINFQYPADWSVTEINENQAAGGYAVDCNEPLLVDSLLKNKTLCVNGEAEPKNIIVQDSAGNSITFWMADGLGGACEDCTADSVTVLGTKEDFEVRTVNGKKSIFIGFTFTPGQKSVWKSYIIKFTSSEAKYSTVKEILSSVKYN